MSHVNSGFDSHIEAPGYRTGFSYSQLSEVQVLFMSRPVLGKDAVSTDTRIDKGMFFFCFNKKC